MSSTPTTPTPPEPLFTSRPPERTPFNIVPWAIAGAVVLLGIAALLFMSHGTPKPASNAILPPDPYGDSLTVSGLAMSEGDSLSGVKSIYLDGRIRNAGPKTVTAITVQVLFANDEAMPPQIETVPLSLIRTHEPYIDTEPISAAPLAPGDEREFRLIFEDISRNWNQQLPAIHAVKVETR